MVGLHVEWREGVIILGVCGLDLGIKLDLVAYDFAVEVVLLFEAVLALQRAVLNVFGCCDTKA